MVSIVNFEAYDAVYLYCVGESVTFDTAWRAYCSIDRICFHDQCDDPAFAPHRQKMASAIQRAINAGFVILADGLLSPSPTIKTRFDALRESGLNEFDASEEIDTFLQSQPWEIVSDGRLST
tara:strand:+ start:221 stop:586 length:366 start_codon:yes stop_codon:yes gene_type:complete